MIKKTVLTISLVWVVAFAHSQTKFGIRLVTKLNGSSFIKNFYRIMSPGQGFRTIITKGIGNLPPNLNSVIFVR